MFSFRNVLLAVFVLLAAVVSQASATEFVRAVDSCGREVLVRSGRVVRAPGVVVRAPGVRVDAGRSVVVRRGLFGRRSVVVR